MRTPNFVLRRIGLVSLALFMCRCDTGSTGYLTATSTGTTASSQTGSSTGETTGSGSATAGTGTAPGVAADGIAIGLCLEAGGIGALAHPIADTFWSSTIVGLGQAATGSNPAATLVVGINDNGTCTLSIPKASSATSSLSRVDAVVDPNFDILLTSLDALNAKVVLEVQPGKASLSDLATAVLSAYGSHASVVGFGVDVRYKGTTGFSSTASMSTSEATSLVNTIQSLQSMNSNILLYAKASSTTNLPDPSTSDVVFVNDSSGFGSLEAMMSTQSEWASFFAPSSVQFDIGNPKDANWWCATDTLTTTTMLMASALKAGSNVTGLYWQADGIISLYPSLTCVSAVAPVATTTTATTGTTSTSGGTTATGTTSGTTGTTSSGTTTTTAGSTSAGTATSGTTSSGTATSGTTSSGTATSGTTSSGTTSSGTTSSGTTSSGTSSSGTTSSGTTSSGTTSSGGTSAGTASAGGTSSTSGTTSASPSGGTSAGSATGNGAN